MNKKGYKLSHVIIIIITTAIISAITSGIIITSSLSVNGKSYSDLVLDENVQEFLEVYSKLSDDYYEDVNKKEMIESAINAMTDYLDETYTTYLESDSAKSLMQELNGKYTGIGITIAGVEVVGVVQNSPAYRAGVQIGDKIISINGTDVSTYSGSEISQLIMQNDDNVLLKIDRNGELLDFTMKVEDFDISPIKYKMIDDTDIGYIEMSIFSNKLTDDTSKALDELKKMGMKKIIIDLRTNTGGFLDQAKGVASLFLEKNKTIYFLEDKDKLTEEKDETSEKMDMPMVVLINGATASAAEILTGALRYSYGAIIVGTKSYGKGKVQHTLTLNDKDMVKYTSSKWLMPNKECIDGKGIIPDYNVENVYVYDEETHTVLLEFVDDQLNRAIELLK